MSPSFSFIHSHSFFIRRNYLILWHYYTIVWMLIGWRHNSHFATLTSHNLPSTSTLPNVLVHKIWRKHFLDSTPWWLASSPVNFCSTRRAMRLDDVMREHDESHECICTWAVTNREARSRSPYVPNTQQSPKNDDDKTWSPFTCSPFTTTRFQKIYEYIIAWYTAEAACLSFSSFQRDL